MSAHWGSNEVDDTAYEDREDPSRFNDGLSVDCCNTTESKITATNGIAICDFWDRRKKKTAAGKKMEVAVPR